VATKKKPAKKAPAKKKPAAKKKAVSKKPAAKKKAVAKKKPAAKKKAVAKKPVKKAKKAVKKVKKAAAKVSKAVVKAVKPAPKKALLETPKKPALVTPKNSATGQYTQSELYDTMVSYMGFQSRKQAKEFYGDFTGMLQAALKNGYKVALPGLGKLQVRKTKARMGVNPMTRERIKIPARKKVAFTANKALKDAVL
jgi:nucleoid DNA-binding protein